jgi:hypothetical protein
MITQEQANRIEKNQERILTLLHKALGNLPESREWVSYEDACKVLNKSRSWYNKIRNGFTPYRKPLLVEGHDWRKVGKDIEYHLPALERLRAELIKKAPALTGA